MATITVLDSSGTPVAIEKPRAAGQTTLVNSTSVALASDHPAISVTPGANFYPATQPVSGTFLTDTQLRATPLTVALSATTITASALPTGASTEATLSTINTKLPTLGAKADSGSVSIVPSTGSYKLLPAASVSRLVTAANSVNATSVKGSAGYLDKVIGYNARATPVFMKFYNLAVAPTAGTGTPILTLYLPAQAAFVIPIEFAFSVGIGYTLTTAAADSDSSALAAGDIVGLNVFYS